MSSLDDIIGYVKNYKGKPIVLMEVCGTHTSVIAKNGLRTILSPKIRLCSGPGCPVCVTSKGYIDKLCNYSMKEGTVVLTFGDMMRVPGTFNSLSESKARGGRVEIFYSPFEVIEKAKKSPEITHIVAAVGFETTVPIYGLMLEKIIKENIKNIKLLTSLKVMPPILEVLCSQENNIDGFIAPGHVSAIIGSEAFNPLARRFKKPFAVSGFTTEEVILGIYDLIKQIERGSNETHNLYKSVVKSQGNVKALNIIGKYFKLDTAFWRGIGAIRASGLYLKNEYTQFDGGSMDIEIRDETSNQCRCNDVIMGRIEPISCKYFGEICTPLSPVGPCMVSGEGACGIWYKACGKK